jgi:diacylglycerol kinase
MTDAVRDRVNRRADLLENQAPEPPWSRRGERQSARGKFTSGLRGIRHAIRGDSSFFAHFYRGVLIALTAILLRVSPLSWCLLAVSATLVLLAEMTNSAIDTVVRAIGDPDAPGMRVAREIANGGVVVAAISSGAITIFVLLTRLGFLLGWWDLVLR